MTACYNGRRTEAISSGLPGGVMRFGQKWVRSRPIEVGDVTCTIVGRFDAVVAFDDGSYGVIDPTSGDDRSPGRRYTGGKSREGWDR
jgi:hypothetical protein